MSESPWKIWIERREDGSTPLEDMAFGLTCAWTAQSGLRRLPGIVARVRGGEKLRYRDTSTLVGTASALVYILASNARLGWVVSQRTEKWKRDLLQKKSPKPKRPPVEGSGFVVRGQG